MKVHVDQKLLSANCCNLRLPMPSSQHHQSSVLQEVSSPCSLQPLQNLALLPRPGQGLAMPDTPTPHPAVPGTTVNSGKAGTLAGWSSREQRLVFSLLSQPQGSEQGAPVQEWARANAHWLLLPRCFPRHSMTATLFGHLVQEQVTQAKVRRQVSLPG
ncbi:hypothetical protein BGY98DRAFT_50479 [Russula aff. rugulosa BPL654]|nr:hypothetical protein BGY98DRAFT_50479 [Russula aff. rugulosa BPL654]